MYPTTPGYVNPQNQKTVLRTDQAGTEYEQWLYVLECTLCGRTYKVNEYEIHDAACPACQGGKEIIK